MPAAATDALIVLARVRAGEGEAARAAIARHWSAGESPFGRVPGTRLGRLQILRAPARRAAWRRGAPQEYALLAADVDAPGAPWVEGLRTAAGAELDAVLGHCAFYPGSAEPAAFGRWIAANRLAAGFSVSGSPEATLHDVREALDLRDRLADFAQDTQRLGPADLHRRWRGWRGR